ncbi:hypothetical protein DIPPA_17432 [Diplonema papillatum]|nr:hypothetical protein DIPPA_33903 [Diplonema papillatum]KAJ9456570.1 hypothetical protein DIPPA_17432 [Diplonema papillatum]
MEPVDERDDDGSVGGSQSTTDKLLRDELKGLRFQEVRLKEKMCRLERSQEKAEGLIKDILHTHESAKAVHAATFYAATSMKAQYETELTRLHEAALERDSLQRDLEGRSPSVRRFSPAQRAGAAPWQSRVDKLGSPTTASFGRGTSKGEPGSMGLKVHLRRKSVLPLTPPRDEVASALTGRGAQKTPQVRDATLSALARFRSRSPTLTPPVERASTERVTPKRKGSPWREGSFYSDGCSGIGTPGSSSKHTSELLAESRRIRADISLAQPTADASTPDADVVVNDSLAQLSGMEEALSDRLGQLKSTVTSLESESNRVFRRQQARKLSHLRGQLIPSVQQELLAISKKQARLQHLLANWRVLSTMTRNPSASPKQAPVPPPSFPSASPVHDPVFALDTNPPTLGQHVAGRASPRTTSPLNIAGSPASPTFCDYYTPSPRGSPAGLAQRNPVVEEDEVNTDVAALLEKSRTHCQQQMLEVQQRLDDLQSERAARIAAVRSRLAAEPLEDVLYEHYSAEAHRLNAKQAQLDNLTQHLASNIDQMHVHQDALAARSPTPCQHT